MPADERIEKSMLVTNTSTPLYEQLKNIIKNDIYDGVYQPGDRMASEAELGKRYEVSRITVRRAIQELEQEGLLCRKQGKGTFVVHQKHKNHMGEVHGFTDSMSRMHRHTDRIILEKGLQNADEDLASYLELPLGAPLIHLKRVMCDDGQPLLIDECWYPVSLFPGMLEEIREDVSTYQLIREKYNRHLRRVHKEFNITLATVEMSQHLKCTPGDPLFSIFKVVYDETSRPLQISKLLVLSSRCTYVLDSDLSGDSQLHTAVAQQDGLVAVQLDDAPHH